VPDEDHVAQVFVLEQVHDVLHMRPQRDLAAREMRPVAEPGERDRVDLVSLRAQFLGHVGPGPTAEPEAWNENERRHSKIPSPTS
jgi:hypothetical protein